MWSKIGQLLVFALAISVTAVLQFSFIPSLPEIAAAFNFVLVSAIFILFFFDWRWALAAAVLAGTWLDILTFNFFGFHILILTLSVLTAHWVLQAWLTNRSLYAWLSLMTLTTIVYDLSSGLLLYLFVYDGRSFFLVNAEFWLQLAYQCADNALAAALLFALAAGATRRLSPFFLEKT
jgi:hypothetical protein